MRVFANRNGGRRCLPRLPTFMLLAAAMLPAINAWAAESEETPPTKVEVIELPQVQVAANGTWVCADVQVKQWKEAPHTFEFAVSEADQGIPCSPEHPAVTGSRYYDNHIAPLLEHGTLYFHTGMRGGVAVSCGLSQYFPVHSAIYERAYLNTSELRYMRRPFGVWPEYYEEWNEWVAVDMAGLDIWFRVRDRADCGERPGATP